MESKIRELIMPLSERLIKQIEEFEIESAKQKKDLMLIEVLVTKLFAEFAVRLISGLIQMWHGRGLQSEDVQCSECGKRMRVQDYLNRTLETMFGTVNYKRAYYYCRGCRRSRLPLDEELGVKERSLSPRLERVLRFLSAHLSFGVVEKALSEVSEACISDETCRVVAEVGADAISWEVKEKQEYEEGEQEPINPKRKKRTFVIEVDGKLVGFQDGSWQEVKIGVIYDVEDRVVQYEGRHELIKREIVARRCSWEEFAELFWAAMQRVGICDGDRIVAIADGAHSMEQIFSFVAPESERVRDFYHVAERIHAIGEIRFGTGSEKAKAWGAVQLKKLKESEVESVMRSISHLKFDSKQAEETRRQVLGYFHNHKEAMDYHSYKNEGLPIGSGAVEGGCRLIGARTNGCGRRWGNDGCDKIVALRVAVLNDRLDLIRPQSNIHLKLAA